MNTISYDANDISYDTQPRIDAVPTTEAGLLQIAKYAIDGWHLWVPAGDDGTKKAPADHTGKRYATGYDATQPFYTYNEIRASYSKNNKNKKTPRGGIGLRVRPPLLAIDLDDVVTWRDGQPMYTDDVKAILKLLPTYAELSPSGTGLHVWVKYDGDHSILPKTDHVLLPHGGKMAIYASHTPNNYLTMTGRAVSVHEDGIPRLYIIDATQSDIETLLNTWHTPIFTTWYTATAPTPPIDDTPTPAQPATAPTPPTDDTPTATAKPATVATYDASNRLKKYIDKTWPAVVDAACEALKNAASYHIARHTIGWQLGVQLRALELACDTVRLPHSAIPAPATVDAIVKTLYDAQPPKANTEDEHETIEDGTQRGYDECATWKQFGDAYKDLHTIMGEHGIPIDASKATKPGKIQPATAPTSKPPTPPTDDTPTATAKPAPAETLIDFDDIIMPTAAQVDELRQRIRNYENQHNKRFSLSSLARTNSELRAMAGKAPKPIIESVDDDAHLIMPGVMQMSAGSKLGKSTIALHFAYVVAMGSDTVFGSPRYRVPRAGHVVYFDLENHSGITGQRAVTSELNPPDEYFHHYDPTVWRQVVTMAAKQKNADGQSVDRWQVLQKFITDALRTWPDTRLLILDNVLQFQPRRRAHETPEELEERYMMWLVWLCDEYDGMSIILVDHNTKATKDDSEERQESKAQGSFRKQAWISAGTMSVYTAPERDKMPPKTLKIKTLPRSCVGMMAHIYYDNTRGYHVLSDVEPLPQSAIQRRIIEAMQNGNVTIPDIQRAIPDITDAHLRKELSVMTAKDAIYRRGYGVYALKTTHTPQTTQHTIDESEAF